MECAVHTGEQVFMVCKSCDKFPFVCGVCIEEEHAEHRLQTLRNAARSIRQNLEQLETENVQVFKEIKSDRDRLNKIREDLQQDAYNVDDEIAKRADIIRRKIDEVNTEVIQKHKREVGMNTQAIGRTEKALKQQVSQIDKFKMKVAQLQKMNDYVDVIKLGRDMEVPDISRIPRPDMHALVFIPGTVRDGELKRMFGGIKTFDSSNNGVTTTMSSDFVGSIERESNIKVTPVTSFKLPKDDGIETVFCSKPGLCWLKCQNKNSVKLSNISGQIIQAVNLGTQTKGFTVTSDNKLLFCCTTQKCIKEIDLSDGEITEIISTTWIPDSICTGPAGEIYLTMYDKKDYDVQKNSYRGLCRCIRGVEYKSQSSQSIFVIPGKVCVNSSGTRLAVINDITVGRGELVILDEDLSPISMYRGPCVLTGNSIEYRPNDAMFDAMDNILVMEGYNKTVQLLSPSCEPLKVLLTMDTPPWTLTMNGEEIWIGDGEGKVQVFRYSY